jgi:iron complex transport system substrate-binding protein
LLWPKPERALRVPRIVSLISSATEIVHSLGQFEFLVGRSHECDFPPAVAALPVCTRPAIPVTGNSREIDQLVKERVRNALSVYEVFDDVLERLQPTHILTQTQCEVCAVSLADVERSVASRLASRPRIVSLNASALADVWDDMRRVASALDVPADAVVDRQARIQTISERALRLHARPRVAMIEWIEPLMAAGNWTPELVAMAGGVDLFGQAGQHAPWMTWQELVARNPDVIVVAPCGFDMERTAEEMYWLTERPEWPDLAGRVFLADGNQFFNRPGPRLVESLQILAEMLHPAEFAPEFEGTAWRRYAS